MFLGKNKNQIKELENYLSLMIKKNHEAERTLSIKETIIKNIIKITKDGRYQILEIIKDKDENDIIIIQNKREGYGGTDLDILIYQLTEPIRTDFFLIKFLTQIRENNIYIQDIITYDDNTSKGYGTIAMNHLKKVAHAERLPITGWISPEDMDHYDRLIHFYQKNGFEVTFNEYSKPDTIIYKHDYLKPPSV
ncbi:hypothetical protein C6370_20420 [Bacillus atrophaeus]|uniref:GNAT family N-acetyltransferase n=1 Tax=Bacillus atrophaeus TaxID=1452 RepID=UPI000D06EDEF|nr:GNAT family N-acetyltransferase [Bacillus atrophaeus]PSA89328.1 hypothetical protein C6370_20420 [Bacillus atrophaeus]